MPENKRSTTSSDKLTAAARREKVASLRLAGASQEEIAAQVGVSIATVCRDIQAIIAWRNERASDDIEAMRRLEDDRLNRRELRINQLIAEAQPVPAGGGRVPRDGDPDLIVKLDARLADIAQRRAKLWGLDAPVRNDVTVVEATQFVISGAQTEAL